MAIHSFPENRIDLKNTDRRFYATDCVSKFLDLGGEYSGRCAWAVSARAELPYAVALIVLTPRLPRIYLPLTRFYCIQSRRLSFFARNSSPVGT